MFPIKLVQFRPCIELTTHKGYLKSTLSLLLCLYFIHNLNIELPSMFLSSHKKNSSKIDCKQVHFCVVVHLLDYFNESSCKPSSFIIIKCEIILKRKTPLTRSHKIIVKKSFLELEWLIIWGGVGGHLRRVNLVSTLYVFFISVSMIKYRNKKSWNHKVVFLLLMGLFIKH